MGRHSVSVLDCREELAAQYRVVCSQCVPFCFRCSSHLSSLITSLSVARRDSCDEGDFDGWRRYDVDGQSSTASLSLRRRGAASASMIDDETSDMTVEDGTDGAVKTKDPILLFGGLVPPPLRKAKTDFGAALAHAIAAANAARSILAAAQALEAASKSRGDSRGGEGGAEEVK